MGKTTTASDIAPTAPPTGALCPKCGRTNLREVMTRGGPSGVQWCQACSTLGTHVDCVGPCAGQFWRWEGSRRKYCSGACRKKAAAARAKALRDEEREADRIDALAACARQPAARLPR